VELSELKAKIFALLKEDLEFKYAVAGLLGYEETPRRPDKLMIVTPYADQEALETAKELGMKVYTGV